MIEQIEIIVKGIHRTVGYIDYEMSTYFTKRAKKNIFKSYYGFGISVPIVEYLIKQGVKYIAISYESHLYGITTAKFYINSFEHKDGRDIQLVLPLAYYNNTEPSDYNKDKKESKKMFKGMYSFKPEPTKEDKMRSQLTMEAYYE